MGQVCVDIETWPSQALSSGTGRPEGAFAFLHRIYLFGRTGRREADRARGRARAAEGGREGSAWVDAGGRACLKRCGCLNDAIEIYDHIRNG
jgi:hypothetical protein